MNKAELVDILVEKTGFKQYQIRKIMTAFVETVSEQVQAENRISLRGLGVFTPIYQNTRPVRNPKTGEELLFEPRNSLKFRPGDDFIRKINQGKK